MRIIAKKTNASIIAVSETWLDDSMTNNELNVPGYNIVKKDRAQYGGGVCLFVRDILPFNVRNNLDVDNLEAIWIELFLKKTKPIVAGCVYRPPNKLNFFEEFKGVLSKIELQCERIVLGDFNICELHEQSKFLKEYLGILTENTMSQLIKELTRVTDRTATLWITFWCRERM